LIKEAIDRILSLAAVTIHDVDGREYSDRTLSPIQPPIIHAIEVSTLSGLVDLIQNGFEAFDKTQSLVHVVDHTKVQLVGSISDTWARRLEFVTAKLTETKGFGFGVFTDHENFIIGVQANFTEAGDREYVLKLASSLKNEKVSTSDDDGVSQKVAVSAGAHLKTSETVRPRVTLAPFRTFREVEQPASEFVFRVQNSGDAIPKLALFEADGGRWKLAAIENVARYLRTSITDIPVIS
jgi:hypothetical protein